MFFSLNCCFTVVRYNQVWYNSTFNCKITNWVDSLLKNCSSILFFRPHCLIQCVMWLRTLYILNLWNERANFLIYIFIWPDMDVWSNKLRTVDRTICYQIFTRCSFKLCKLFLSKNFIRNIFSQSSQSLI